MTITDKEKERGLRASRFLKAEPETRRNGYKELADKLNAHGLDETETSITGKLSRGAFAVSFFLAVLTVLNLKGWSQITLGAIHTKMSPNPAASRAGSRDVEKD